MKKLLLGAIAGGLILFVWGYLSHTVLPLGSTGLHSLPNEETLVPSLSAAMTQAGMYYFPGGDMLKMTPEQQKAWTEKYKAGPVGLIIFQPTGSDPMSGEKMLTELGFDLLAALIVAWILSQTVVAYRKRVIISALIGFFGWVTISAPYWNWYNFPIDFTMAQAAEQIVGWTLAGLAIAAFVRPRGD
jgi:hypothetical protein